MLTVEKIAKCFDEKTVLDDLSFTCPSRGVTAIMGASGVGKTTLLNIIADLQKPDQGKITSTFNKISYKFQEPRLFEWLTALENVKMVIEDVPNAEKTARDLLTRVGLGESLSKYPRELSGGMQQRVALARALAYGGDLLLLDEPFSAVDTETRGILLDVISEYAKNYAVLIVTHSKEEAQLLNADIIMLN